MSLRYILLTVVPALALGTDAFSQSRASIRYVGAVNSVTGSVAAPFDGAAVGDPVTVQYEALLPGTGGGPPGDETYVIDPQSVRVQIGTAVDFADPTETPLLILRTGTVAAWISNVRLSEAAFDVIGLDFGPPLVFPTPDLTQLVGTYGPSEFDLLGVNLIGDQSGLEIALSEIRIGIAAAPGTNYCGPAVPNSSGDSATISATGSDEVALNDLTLVASDLPQSSFSFFLVSTSQGSVANPGGSAGTLCLGGSIGRFVGPGQIQNSGAAGQISLPLDLTSIPQPNGAIAIAAGQTWNFQGWFRDSVGGTATSNFTDGLSVTFE
ncbi:MAG: hypothetical protein AAGB93_13625 [Planctomycetota bacterium]